MFKFYWEIFSYFSLDFSGFLAYNNLNGIGVSLLAPHGSEGLCRKLTFLELKVMPYNNYTPVKKEYGEDFRPSASRWDGLYEEDTIVTYYSNARIFSSRTERDDTVKMGKLYRHLEDDEE